MMKVAASGTFGPITEGAMGIDAWRIGYRESKGTHYVQVCSDPSCSKTLSQGNSMLGAKLLKRQLDRTCPTAGGV